MKRVSYYGTIFSPFSLLRPLAMLASPPTPAYLARVDLFVGLMRKRVRFHPVEVLVEPDGRFVIADGHHRTAASLQCGYTHLPTLLYASQERRRVALPWGGVCRHKKEPRAGLSRTCIQDFCGVGESRALASADGGGGYTYFNPQKFMERFGGEKFDPPERGRGTNWAKWKKGNKSLKAELAVIGRGDSDETAANDLTATTTIPKLTTL